MAIEKTAGAVVYRNNDQEIEYLLLQSTNEGNFWGFPKVTLRAMKALKTAQREIKEETSLVLHDTSFLSTLNTTCPTATGSNDALHGRTAKDEDLHLQAEEIKNAGWFNYQDARQRLTYDNLKELLDQVDAHLTQA